MNLGVHRTNLSASLLRFRVLQGLQLFLRRLCILAVALCMAGQGLNGEQQTRYDSSIPMSSEMISFGGVCVAFTASMNSPDFKGVKRVDSPSGSEFYRAKKVISKFPDVVDVLVWATPYLCSSRDRTKQPKDLAMENMQDMTFHFSWKHDFEMRPAELLDSVKNHFPARNIWFFNFQVKETAIPLTDHLILHIVDKEGVEQAKLSGRL